MEGVLGTAKGWVHVFEQLDRVVQVPCPVLLTGPHGSGKHTCARALHRAATPSGPFVFVDALAHAQAQSAQTSPALYRLPAESSPEHWVRAAAGGTLFINELSALPAAWQVFLAQSLREPAQSRARFRIVAGSQHPASVLSTHPAVRPDFFYQVRVLSCALPNLAARGTDIVVLAEAFLPRRNTGPWHLSAAARRLLLSYSWPGNMNELRSALQYAAAVAVSPCLQANDLPEHVRSSSETPPRTLLPEGGTNLREVLESIETELVQQALDRTEWNKQKAASLLGLNRTTLVEMLKRKRLRHPVHRS